LNSPIVIAIDGTSASGKSTNAKRVAKMLGYAYVDTGAMYRTFAWHCLQKKVNIDDEKAVSALCRKWKTTLECIDGKVHLLVDGYYPEKEIRTDETTSATSHIAAYPKVRDWMKNKQRECIQFGNLVMEGRDIGTNVFPEVFVGSGVTARSLPEYLPHADGFIVGSAFKPDNDPARPAEARRVRELLAALG
jgi:cytidylate kinase